MFWGGEMVQEIALSTEKSLPRVSFHPKGSQTKKSVAKIAPVVDFNKVPSFELKIAAGAPLRSKSLSLLPISLLLCFLM
jgi:hypothetical protein